jgi:hypothetical protein
MKVLGRLACRVCSKILGIGNAEQNWDDVKHLKTNNRSDLGLKNVKMQASIFGASCAETANMKRRKKSDDPYSAPIYFWVDDDFEDETKENFGETIKAASNKAARIVRVWVEEWEAEATKKRDPVHETKLPRKN